VWYDLFVHDQLVAAQTHSVMFEHPSNREPQHSHPAGWKPHQLVAAVGQKTAAAQILESVAAAVGAVVVVGDVVAGGAVVVVVVAAAVAVAFVVAVAAAVVVVVEPQLELGRLELLSSRGT